LGNKETLGKKQQLRAKSALGEEGVRTIANPLSLDLSLRLDPLSGKLDTNHALDHLGGGVAHASLVAGSLGLAEPLLGAGLLEVGGSVLGLRCFRNKSDQRKGVRWR
jgi:hypothetical protein